MTLGVGWCEVRTTNGSDNNGGGFSVSGNTYSTTGGATTATTTPTFTGGADYTIVNGDDGDYLYLVSGANSIPSVYKMTVSGGVCTLDRPCGTSATLTTLSWSIIRVHRSAPFLVIDNSTVTTSITTTAITFTGGYTPHKTDVGNWALMTGGTNVNLRPFQIKSVAGSVWTMDSNVVTSGTTTDATGNMGGARATLPSLTDATVGSVTNFGSVGMKYFWRSESTIAAPFVTAAMNLTAIGGTPSNTVMYNRVIGFVNDWWDITGWPNFTNNASRPVIKHSAVSGFFTTTKGWTFENFIMDGGSITNGAGIISSSTSGMIAIYNCLFKNYGDGSSGRAVYQSYGDTLVVCCEFFAWNTRTTSPGDGGVCGLFSAYRNHISRCVFHDGAGPAFSADPGTAECVNCLFVNITGGGVTAAISLGNGNSAIGNTVVNCANNGISFAATSAGLNSFTDQCYNNMIFGCGAYGLQLAKTIGAPPLPWYDGNCYIANTTGTRQNADDGGATNPVNYSAPYTNVLDVLVGPAAGGSKTTYDPFVKRSDPVTDLATDASNPNLVTSVSHTFTTADLNATFYITNQTGGWIFGEYKINSISGSGAIVTNVQTGAAPAPTATTSGTWYFNNYKISPSSAAAGLGAIGKLPGFSNGGTDNFGVFQTTGTPAVASVPVGNTMRGGFCNG